MNHDNVTITLAEMHEILSTLLWAERRLPPGYLNIGGSCVYMTKAIEIAKQATEQATPAPLVPPAQFTNPYAPGPWQPGIDDDAQDAADGAMGG